MVFPVNNNYNPYLQNYQGQNVNTNFLWGQTDSGFIPMTNPMSDPKVIEMNSFATIKGNEAVLKFAAGDYTGSANAKAEVISACIAALNTGSIPTFGTATFAPTTGTNVNSTPSTNSTDNKKNQFSEKTQNDIDAYVKEAMRHLENKLEGEELERSNAILNALEEELKKAGALDYAENLISENKSKRWYQKNKQNTNPETPAERVLPQNPARNAAMAKLAENEMNKKIANPKSGSTLAILKAKYQTAINLGARAQQAGFNVDTLETQIQEIESGNRERELRAQIRELSAKVDGYGETHWYNVFKNADKRKLEALKKELSNLY